MAQKAANNGGISDCKEEAHFDAVIAFGYWQTPYSRWEKKYTTV